MNKLFITLTFILLLILNNILSFKKRKSELIKPLGNELKQNIINKLPHEYIDIKNLPKNFDWGKKNLLTPNRNQHIPQYCGSCWAMGSMTALSDRIKIARARAGTLNGPDIILSVQYILNCGSIAGSCHGGYHSSVYEFLSKNEAPFEDCLSYTACSKDSDEGFCKSENHICKPINVCRTCSTFKENGGYCSEILQFPNATVNEYGPVKGFDNIRAEIVARGPVAAAINADYIDDYEGGILDVPKGEKYTNHVVSITGYGYDEKINKYYWIIRNSWGSYWGENGFMRLVAGENQLGIEGEVFWATPKQFSLINPKGCHENGENCAQTYKDPSTNYVKEAKKYIREIITSLE